jgi:hypothetical protein
MMAEHLKALDISDMPEVRRLAEEVSTTREARILCTPNGDLAVVSPLGRGTRRNGHVKTEADLSAFRSAAGGWKDVDTDRLVEDIYETRRRSNRPPVEL